MPDWSVIEPALANWVNTITGLDTHWAKRLRAMSFTDAGWCRLNITGRSTVGNDLLRREYDSGHVGGDIRTYQDGCRTFTLQVQVRTWLQTVDVDAKTYTSLIRDSVDLPNLSTAAFNAADIAFARILSETDLDVIQDGREMSVAQIDLRFNAVSITEDTPDTWIETINDAELQSPRGTVRDTGDYTVG